MCLPWVGMEIWRDAWPRARRWVGWPTLTARVSQPVLPLTLSAGLLSPRSLLQVDVGSWALLLEQVLCCRASRLPAGHGLQPHPPPGSSLFVFGVFRFCKNGVQGCEKHSVDS